MSTKLRIELNTFAIVLLAEGRYAEAMAALKAALRTLSGPSGYVPTSDAATGPFVGDTSFAVSTPSNQPPREPYKLPRGAIYTVPILRLEQCVALSPDNLFPLYSYAFAGDPEMMTALSDAGWMAILMYNLAIASHLHALIHRSRNHRALRQVMELYQKVMKVAYYHWNADERAWILMALTCNMGHIHSHRLNFVATRQCLSLLLRMTAQSYAEKLIPRDDYRVFFDTVCTFLEGMDLSIAPAA